MALSPSLLLIALGALLFVAVVGFALGRWLGQSAERAVTTTETARLTAERARFETIAQRVPALERIRASQRGTLRPPERSPPAPGCRCCKPASLPA